MNLMFPLLIKFNKIITNGFVFVTQSNENNLYYFTIYYTDIIIIDTNFTNSFQQFYTGLYQSKLFMNFPTLRLV